VFFMTRFSSVIGLDLSLTGAGIVTLGPDGEVLCARTVGYGLERGATYARRIERVLGIALAVVRAYKDAPQPCGVCIEGFAYRAHGAQNDLGELQGVVKTQLWIADRVEPCIATVSTVRKAVFGAGNTKKATVLKLVRAVWPEVGDHNQADAWALAAYRWGESDGWPAWTRAGVQCELVLTGKKKRARRSARVQQGDMA
jgi:Holliday junction resolvasome RuvABC endonuclease subunit